MGRASVPPNILATCVSNDLFRLLDCRNLPACSHSPPPLSFSLTHPLTHSLIHLLTALLTHWLAHSLIH